MENFDNGVSIELKDAIMEVSVCLDKINSQSIWTSEQGLRYIKLDVFINAQPNQFNKHAKVQQSLSQEARELGFQKQYCGSGRFVQLNGKNIRNLTQQTKEGNKSVADLLYGQNEQPKPQTETAQDTNQEDDLPF